MAPTRDRPELTARMLRALVAPSWRDFTEVISNPGRPAELAAQQHTQAHRWQFT
jgi:hypothetical protein